MPDDALKYVGRQQRRIIKLMYAHPLRGWPTKWAVFYRDGQILARLEQKGFIRPSPSPSIRWVLTDEGCEVARHFT